MAVVTRRTRLHQHTIVTIAWAGSENLEGVSIMLLQACNCMLLLCRAESNARLRQLVGRRALGHGPGAGLELASKDWAMAVRACVAALALTSLRFSLTTFP